MSIATEKPKEARLFVALDLPAALRRGIAAWGRRELRDPALRPVREESLHVTLAFLGARPETEVEQLAAILRESAAPVARLALGQPEQRPLRGRARVYALPVDCEDLTRLQAGLRQRLVRAGLPRPETRPFWPHLTVARVRSEGGRRRPPMRVERAPGELPQGLLRPFGGVRLALYRSELQPDRAHYVSLAQVELPGEGGSEVI